MRPDDWRILIQHANRACRLAQWKILESEAYAKLEFCIGGKGRILLRSQLAGFIGASGPRGLRFVLRASLPTRRSPGQAGAQSPGIEVCRQPPLRGLV